MSPYSPGTGAVEVGYRGYYERTDVRMPDGSRLAPVPILQFIDKKARKTFSVLPDFLVRYKRYLVCVIEDAVLDYAGGTSVGNCLLSASGPDESTLMRWCYPLLDGDVRRALESHLQQMNLNWRSELLSSVERDYPRPPSARSVAWDSLQMLRCLRWIAATYEDRKPYHYLQETWLRCRRAA